MGCMPITTRVELTVQDAVFYVERHGAGVCEDIDAIITAAVAAMVRLHPEATLACLTALADEDDRGSIVHHECKPDPA